MSQIKAVLERLEVLTAANVKSIEAEEKLKKDLKETLEKEVMNRDPWARPAMMPTR